ncbi:MAG: M48 family metalloprotease [Proteobacteria bacterium]|nr:M48 family metalloprotease [Pseudomonadota bacterium]
MNSLFCVLTLQKFRCFLGAFFFFLIAALTLAPEVWSVFDFKKGVVIRDSETEHMLKAYIDPLFKVAGLKPGEEKIIIIIDPEMNAAAMAGQMMIINTGFLLQSKTVWDVIGVLAHETGHIAGNHISRREDSFQKILNPALLTGLVGTAAGLFLGGIEGGAAAALGAAQIAERSLLQYNRGQEASADQSALRYLNELHWSPQGLLNTFEELSGQELLLTNNQDPYVRTHPLTQERLDTMKRAVENSPYKNVSPPAHFEEMFKRVHVKLFAFLSPPAQVLSKFSEKDQSLEAHYARSIAYLKLNQTNNALKEINILLHDFPEDPFFLEMKGQILFMAGRIQEAIPPYEKAVSLRPEDASLKLAFAQTLLEDQTSQFLKKARVILEEVLTKDPDEAIAWRLKAIALGRENKIGLAALALSEYALRAGDIKQATLQIEKALKNLSRKDPAFLRAQDIKNTLDLPVIKDKITP